MSQLAPIFWILGLVALAYGIFRASHALRGETVGEAKGLMQGEQLVPGVGAKLVVKRRMKAGRPVAVQLQVRSTGFIKAFDYTPARALDLARALEEGIARARMGEDTP